MTVDTKDNIAPDWHVECSCGRPMDVARHSSDHTKADDHTTIVVYPCPSCINRAIDAEHSRMILLRNNELIAEYEALVEGGD